MYFLLFLYLQYVQLCNLLSRLRYHREQQRLRGRVMATVYEQGLHYLTQKHTQENTHE